MKTFEDVTFLTFYEPNNYLINRGNDRLIDNKKQLLVKALWFTLKLLSAEEIVTTSTMLTLTPKPIAITSYEG